MSSRQSVNRLSLSKRINQLGKMVQPCSRCAQSKLECRLLLGSKKCGNCTRRGLKCNARDVSDSDFAKLDREASRLDSEIRRSREDMESAMARWKRFERLREALKEKEMEMVRRGLDNIEELERIEEEERMEKQQSPPPSSVPPDPITMLEDFSSEIPEVQWDAFLASTTNPGTYLLPPVVVVLLTTGWVSGDLFASSSNVVSTPEGASHS